MKSRFHPNHLLLAMALALLAIAANLPALRAGFVWDDDLWVTQNASLLSTAGLGHIWFEPRSTPQYYPLVLSTFWLEHRAWGLNPVGYHLDNLLLHAANAVLVWLLLKRLGLSSGAWIAAALFAVHPVHVESVAWVTERKNVLSGFFFLASALVWLRFETRGSWRLYAGALLLFLAALLSKTVTCSLPAVLLLIAWWKEGQGAFHRRRLVLLAPFFGLGAAMGLTTAWLEKTMVGANGPEWNLSFGDRLLIAGRALWFYAGKLVWPQPVCFVYPRWHLDTGIFWQWLFPATALLLAGALWKWRGRIGRGPFAAVAAFAAMLFPALGFINVYPMRYSFVADHFQYLASLALLAPAGVYLARLPSRVRAVAIPALLGVFALIAADQCGAYRSPEVLWRDTLAKNPEAIMAYNNLALLLVAEGRATEALAPIATALQIDPEDSELQTNAGVVLASLGQNTAAIEHYRAACRIAPRLAQAHNGLGSVLASQGGSHLEEAVGEFTQAIRYRAAYPGAQFNLGVSLLRLGRQQEGIPHLRAALRLSPKYPEARHALLQALRQTGQMEEYAAVERLPR